MRTGRPRKPLILTSEECDRLQSLSHRARSQPLLARRARVVLACAEGLANNAVAKRLRCSLGMVGKWRSRFLKTRLEGLYDEPRPGTPRKVSDAQIEQIVIQTLESIPRAQTHWSTRSLAQATGLSRMTISRIWRAFGLQPHRTDIFKLSPDPLLIEKVRDIVGLYMNPPDHALVFCVDEKSQIQALDRTQPLLPFTAGAARAPHPRLQTPWHDFPVCRAGIEDQPRDWPTAPPPSLRGISPVLGCDRGAGARRTGGASHRGQLRHPQNRDHPEMVRETPKISCPLYPHLRFLDQPGGALVRRNHQQANSTRRVPKRERAGSRHPRIHRGAQRKSQALRLDQNGGPNPRQHLSLRPAHVRHPSVLTYVTNHCDKRLVHRTSLILFRLLRRRFRRTGCLAWYCLVPSMFR